MRNPSTEIVTYAALQDFAASVTAKMTQVTLGEPEEQLRGPFETFMDEVGSAFGWNVVCTGETPLPDRLGRPDYAVHRNQLLVGYVELKAPGVGAMSTRFKGHNRNQFKRFSAIPNILYTDGNEWTLYRDGKQVRSCRLSGDVAADGKKAAVPQDAHDVEDLLRDFFSWNPSIPVNRNGKIDLNRFAAMLAPLCRMLRDDVMDALKDPKSPLVQLAQDWRQLLFPDASDGQFADAYAQTVPFALLLGRSEGADPLTLDSAENALAVQHNLLSRALQVLTDPDARADIAASLDLLLRVIAVVPSATLIGPEDPWLYFYEDFLAAYDPDLREKAGAYYTPVEVVRAQVRLIDDLLVNRLGKPLGFADPGVVTLDPAVGTGTYLLGVIEHALGRIKKEQGKGAIPGQASTLAKNLYGFELLVGPYAVSELRVSRALRDSEATLPAEGTHIYLTDTLESPHAEPPRMPFILRPIAEQHRRALKVKSEVPVIVCLGNPPYDRHDAVDTENEDNLSPYGGWVRFGDPLPDDVVRDRRGRERELRTPKARLERRQQLAILKDFIDPATDAGHGIHVKNLYNLYVYFWRWALWKVFEQDAAEGPGIVSFISASSYLDGDAFAGMREHIRRQCDEVWILDLGGEGRGTRQDSNVFAIQTPVAIAVAFRAGEVETDKPAKIRYARVEGTSAEKLAALDAIDGFAKVKWQDCPDDWQASFRPAGEGAYFTWPLLTDLMPWQHSGTQFKRTWPIAPDAETLERRWRGLLASQDRAAAFKETRDRKIHSQPSSLFDADEIQPAIAELPRNAPIPRIERYAYRSFDRQHIIADTRLGDYLRPDLWRIHSEQQVYLTSLLNHPLGKGPAATACSYLPDLHHFRGSYGAKEVFPLYRTADASQANITPDLLKILGTEYKRKVTPEHFLAYLYGVLAQPAFTTQFEKELGTRQLCVPITKDAALFEKVRKAGARLLWLHTYGERFVPTEQTPGRVPLGAAKCVEAIPGHAEEFIYNDANQTLRISGGVFAPVAPEVYEFEVSGLKVVQSWLKYRMKKGGGKKSSPLDDIRPVRWTSQFTTELLELLWVLEETVKCYPEQKKLLEAVITSDCFQANEMPPVPDEMRKPPKAQTIKSSLFDTEDGD